VKTLEIERKGFLSAKETENKSNTSREESLLDKIEAFLASLIKQRSWAQVWALSQQIFLTQILIMTN
jgi:hypothetical protein